MNNKGVTLVELLVSLCIVGIVMAGFYNCFLVQHNNYMAQETITEMNQAARVSVTKMVRELRMAGYKKPGSNLNGIPAASQTSITVAADLNKDGDTSDPDEQVTYSYNAGTQQITRTANGQTEALCDNVTSFSLSYVLTDGSTTSAPANPANIRKVNVSFSVKSEKPITKSGAYSDINLSFDTTPRNMGL